MIYSTDKNRRLTDYLVKNTDRHLSTHDIILAVCGADGKGKSTVYRQLRRLVENGDLMRMRGADGKQTLYQYVGGATGCSRHFHLKCTVCGRVIHLDCGRIEEFCSHISAEHAFLLDPRKTVMYGKCIECAENAAKATEYGAEKGD